MLIYVAGLNPRVGDISQNSKKILESIDIAREKEADILLFAESSLLGYPAEDLLLYNSFIEEINENEKKIIKASKDLFIVLGTIRKNKNKGKPLFNTACIINNQKVLGYKDKTLLPTYDVFDERRYFEVGKKQKVFKYKNKKIGVLICEDAWIDSDDAVADAAGINASVTSITVTDADGTASDLDSPRFQVGHLIRIESEYLDVQAVNTSTNVLTVKRGVNGSTAATHALSTQIDVFRPIDNIQMAAMRLAVWRYRQKDVNSFDRTTILGTGIAITPAAIPADVLSLLPVDGGIVLG